MTLQVASLLHQRYRIQAVLARGGMGALYHALDESLGVEVALKENLYTAEESTTQFHREATLLASLRHPNLPRVTDHFVISGQGQYLVMDYIAGNDLRQRMQTQSRISEPEAVRIGTTICEALAYLHSRTPAIIHRDIKPGNIKITPDGHIFLVDFGLAKIADAHQVTLTGAQALTPGFAPPEQYGQGTDSRSDLYALGATLYAALTQTVPEDGLSRLTENALLTPLRQLNPDISPALAAVITRAMSVAPADRYASATEMKDALHAAAQSLPGQSPAVPVTASDKTQATSRPHAPEPVLPGPASPPPSRPTPSRKRFPFLPVFLGGVLVLGVVATALLVFLKRPPPDQAPSAPTVLLPPAAQLPTHLSTSTPKTILSTATSTALSQAALPPTDPTPTLVPVATPRGGGGGQIVFASDRSGLPQLWLMNADGSNQKQITDLPDGACQPAWSPDGSRLVFTSPCQERSLDVLPGAALFLMNADGGSPTPLMFTPGGDFEPDWSPDGQRIVFCSLRDGLPHIYVYDLDTQQVTNLSAPTSNDRRPAWSPDGSLIAYETTRLGALQIWLLDPAGSSKPNEFSVLDNGVGSMASWSPDGSTITFTQSSGLPWPASKQFTAINTPLSLHQETKITALQPAWHTDYSPDGYWITFEHHPLNDPGRNLDIYLARTNGSSLERLTDAPGDDFDPAWRPVP